MWRLDVSSEAEVESFEAALRYERERIGLGVRFETQVDTVFARLIDNPFQFPVIEEGVRRAIVRVFPYAVYFTLEVDLINGARRYFTCIGIRTRGSDGAGTPSEKRLLAQALIRNAKPPAMPNCFGLKNADRIAGGFEVDFGTEPRPKCARERA